MAEALNSENISNLPFMEETYDWDAILEEKGEPDESDCSSSGDDDDDDDDNSNGIQNSFCSYQITMNIVM